MLGPLLGTLGCLPGADPSPAGTAAALPSGQKDFFPLVSERSVLCYNLGCSLSPQTNGLAPGCSPGGWGWMSEPQTDAERPSCLVLNRPPVLSEASHHWWPLWGVTWTAGFWKLLRLS